MIRTIGREQNDEKTRTPQDASPHHHSSPSYTENSYDKVMTTQTEIRMTRMLRHITTHHKVLNASSLRKGKGQNARDRQSDEPLVRRQRWGAFYVCPVTHFHPTNPVFHDTLLGCDALLSDGMVMEETGDAAGRDVDYLEGSVTWLHVLQFCYVSRQAPCITTY
ncbi:hypothetical protein E2C01_071130 [Portunus trituberculatus]|uniref:Uncharacterized protein n=1 Tax=Portunus trituberculatus TaxID=210409 RepID=A0A5B7I3H1_PORTR|nr:hypothetical protein [Portunus trituberculatus]